MNLITKLFGKNTDTKENTVIIQSTEKTNGDTGVHVFLLQCALAYHEYGFGYVNDELATLHSVGIDGVFGGNTYNALCAFQRDHDIKETGIADSDTVFALLKDYNLEGCE